MGIFRETIFILFISSIVIAKGDVTENLFSKMYKNMTESEIRSSFVVWDNETVDENEIVEVYHRMESKDKVIIKLSAFGKDYTFNLEPTIGLLKSDGYLPMFEISKDGLLREITKGVAKIGKPHFDNKNSASMMLTFDKDKNVLTEGYIGSELFIRPLRNASLYRTVDHGKKNNIVNYPHLILKKPPQLKNFPYDSLKNDDDTMPRADLLKTRTKKRTDESNADLKPDTTGSDSSNPKDSINRRSKRNLYPAMSRYTIPILPRSFPRVYPGWFLGINPYLFLRRNRMENPRFNPNSNSGSNDWKPPRDTAIVEVLLFIDSSIHQFYGGNEASIKNHYFSFMNSVSQIYKSLDSPKIQITISGIVISTNNQEMPYMTDSNLGYNRFDGKMALNQMAQFTGSQYDRLRSHDIIIAITKLDMTENYNSGTMGYAMVGGACQSGNNVGIVEDSNNKGVEVAAHEIGHLLGASHDGDPFNSARNCESRAEHYMNAVLMDARYKQWSQCSRMLFNSFLRSPQASCLYRESGKREEIPQSAPKITPNQKPPRKLSYTDNTRNMGGRCVLMNGYSICS